MYEGSFRPSQTKWHENHELSGQLAGHRSVARCTGESQALAFGTYRASGIGYQCAEEQTVSRTEHYFLRDDAGLLLYESEPFTTMGGVFALSPLSKAFSSCWLLSQ